MRVSSGPISRLSSSSSEGQSSMRTATLSRRALKGPGRLSRASVTRRSNSRRRTFWPLWCGNESSVEGLEPAQSLLHCWVRSQLDTCVLQPKREKELAVSLSPIVPLPWVKVLDTQIGPESPGRVVQYPQPAAPACRENPLVHVPPRVSVVGRKIAGVPADETAEFCVG